MDFQIRSLINVMGWASSLVAAATPSKVEALPASFAKSNFRRFHFENSIGRVIKPMGCFVGELQEKWQFPSDHLPIGANIDGIEVGSWNVLNAKYMNWVIEKNSQGLSHSQIAQKHVVIKPNGLTERDVDVVDQILSMIENGKSLLSFQ